MFFTRRRHFLNCEFNWLDPGWGTFLFLVSTMVHSIPHLLWHVLKGIVRTRCIMFYVSLHLPAHPPPQIEFWTEKKYRKYVSQQGHHHLALKIVIQRTMKPQKKNWGPI